MELSHFNESGRARMVDVSAKDATLREATAGGRVLLNKNTYDLILNKGIKKGDVLSVAQVAGIMAAKKTSEIIPMCHNINLTSANIEFKPDSESCSIEVIATVKTKGETGVEMEALHAASVAMLTIYDMCKAVQRDIVLEKIELLKKTGGKSGTYMKDGYAEVVSVSISEKKGTRKTPVDYVDIVLNHGISGDAHAGDWHRQVSLLGIESMNEMKKKLPDLGAGDFAENILTRGIELYKLPIGTVLQIGAVSLKVTQIGKECHGGCEIRRLTGDCVMPREGIFAVALNEGRIAAGDKISIIS